MEAILIPAVIIISIIMVIVYFKTQKLSSLAFSLSAVTYVIGVLFTIDAFSLEQEIIFFVLLFSAGLMTFIGIYLTRLKNGKKKRK
jgi:hypothetical protein